MHEIFVNYRTGDAHDAATTIQLDLVRRFGQDAVFFASRSLKFGQPYPQALVQEATRARILIAVIGPDWLRPDTDGVRPLDDEQDWIRVEIALAIRNGAAVIPVLVGRQTGRLPRDLPEDIRILADYPYCRYDHREAATSLNRIAEAAVEAMPELVDRTAADEPAPAAEGFSSHGQSGGIGQVGMSGGSVRTEVRDNHGILNTGVGAQNVHQFRVDGSA